MNLTDSNLAKQSLLQTEAEKLSLIKLSQNLKQLECH